MAEGLNNKAKLTMRKSYGFRTFHVTEIALYHALYFDVLRSLNVEMMPRIEGSADLQAESLALVFLARGHRMFPKKRA
jgi:hypothetical protein